MCFVISGGITHTLLTCELILLTCVKDLLYRLLSMTEVKRLSAYLLSTWWSDHYFQKISSFSYLVCTFRLSRHFVRLSTESVAEATITVYELVSC